MNAVFSQTLLVSITVILGVYLDYRIGEPKHYHPLIGFGHYANKLEKRLNSATQEGITIPFSYNTYTIFKGAFAWLAAVFIPLIITLLFYYYLPRFQVVFDTLALYVCIGYNSLRQHIMAVYLPLENNQIPQARCAVAKIVSRDTQSMNESDIRKAAIESTLENGNDAIFGAIFWFLIAGGPGVIVYRLANTLDAMWGYRNRQFEYFGKASAYVDDILNWIPARLTAMSYALVGHFPTAIKAWKQQAHLCASPNGGPVMTAGAGALQTTLGGNARYHGKNIERPNIGLGKPPTNSVLKSAIRLIDRTVFLWCMTIISIGWLCG